MRTVPHDALLRAGLVEPVAPDEERLWRDCDLAALAEHRLGDVTDPTSLTPERRSDWIARATTDGDAPLADRDHERCYWLREGGARVGTIAVSGHAYGVADAGVSSFYVLPGHRGRGVGARALRRLGEALAAERFGYRLETAWAWRRTVRFYLREGLWVRSWKRELALFWSDRLPRTVVDVGEREATLSVARGGATEVLARARYEGAWLEWEVKELAGDDRGLLWHAGPTLALALALEGKPLVRSADAWARCRHADVGPPESLAYKIAVWEAFDRAQGWPVEQPRIPGLAYPTWAELEARWSAERASFEAELEASGGAIRARE